MPNTPSRSTMSRYRVWIAFVLLSLTWGSSYLFIRIGVRQITPLSLVALRLLFGAITIALIAALMRTDLRISRRSLLTVLGVSVISTTLPFLLITWGEETVTSGLASVLNSTTPIFSLLVAHLVLRDEPITLPRLAGVAVGFLGVLLLLSRDLAGSSIQWSGVAGQGAVVVAALCYALAAVLTRRLLRHLPSMTIASYTLWLAAAQAVVLSLIFSPPPFTSLHFNTLFAVVWLGVLGSGLAYVFYYFIIMSWGAARATLVTYVIPAIGLALGAIFLQEIVDWRIAAGSALVILGIGLASIIRRRPQPASTEPPTRHRGPEPECSAAAR